MGLIIVLNDNNTYEIIENVDLDSLDHETQSTNFDEFVTFLEYSTKKEVESFLEEVMNLKKELEYKSILSGNKRKNKYAKKRYNYRKWLKEKERI